jgi:RNA polymerase sigma-70 factor (ECF subfamily)
MTTNFLGWVSELARTHTRELARVAQGEGLLQEDALDAVQEAFHTFLGMSQARALAGAPEEAVQLMAVLVRNGARNMRRRHHRSHPHVDLEAIEEATPDEPSTEQLLARSEEHVALLGCVRRLSQVQRRVVTLRMLEELAPEVVAAELELTPGHVAVLLHRAKHQLRLCLES